MASVAGAAVASAAEPPVPRPSTRLRSNVADRVSRDLLPAGRVLSVVLVSCELLAELLVLFFSRGQPCDRPLRIWLRVLMCLQLGTIALNSLALRFGADTFDPHRLGLSASDVELYVGARPDPNPSSGFPGPREQHPHMYYTQSTPPEPQSQNILHHQHLPDHADGSSSHASSTGSIGEDADAEALLPASPETRRRARRRRRRRRRSLSREARRQNHLDSSNAHAHSRILEASDSSSGGSFGTGRGPDMGRTRASRAGSTSNMFSASTDSIEGWARVINAWYLVMYIVATMWLTDEMTCGTTAPHLYRLVVALSLIYFTQLFLPVTCFCLIVCCLPVFLILFRILLPFAERDRRRLRAADRSLIDTLAVEPYVRQSNAGTRSDDDEDANCIICLCQYEVGEMVRTLPCNHQFHASCIDEWLLLDKSCALCRVEIDDPSINSSTAEDGGRDSGGVIAESEPERSQTSFSPSETSFAAV
jgi:Ring finger domain